MKKKNNRTPGQHISPILAGAVLVMAATAANAASTFNNPADVKAITDIETVLASDLDMKAVMRNYNPQAIALDVVAPGVYRGKAAIYRGYAPQLGQMQAITHYTMPELNIASDGHFACAALTLNLDIKMKIGKSQSMSLRELDAYQKTGGQWQIVQQQVSWPVDPKTGMAGMTAPAPDRGALAWSGNPFAGPAEPVAQAKADIRNWTTDLANATRIDQVAAAYGTGDNILVYNESLPGELRGAREVRDHYAPMMSGIAGAKVTMPLFSARSDGVFGLEISTQDLALTLKDGTRKTYAFRQSDCLRRIDGEWHPFFEMVSFPADPKTGKAVGF